MTETILQVSNVSKKVGDKTLVDRLSFGLQEGEILGLLGPNGAGKTTTMRMIVGMISITSGDIKIGDVSVKSQYKSFISEVGAIIENPEFYPMFTGYENLLYFLRMHKGIPKTRIDEVVSLVGLTEAIHKKVKAYSLGMRQRLGIAQALIHRPKILILDEPTNGLDPAGIKEMREYMKKIAKEEGTSILVSSHLLSEIEQMCDRVVIIQNGVFVTTKDMSQQTEDTNKRIVFTFENSKPAQDVLNEEFQSKILSSQDTSIEFSLTHEEIPTLNALFVEKGIHVFGIQEKNKSLEEEFLEITGGNSIV